MSRSQMRMCSTCFRQLVDKSLVMVDPEASEPRYWVLESFRQYAREKLVARGEYDLVAHRHALTYLGLAQSLGAYYDESEEAFLARAYDDLDNWRAALRWALADRGDIHLGQRLVGELGALWCNIAPAEGRRWLGCALELIDERTPRIILARLSYVQATVAFALSEVELMLASSRTAITHYRLIGDSLGIARAQHREGCALLYTGRFDEARVVLNEALSFARSIGNRWLVGSILQNFATLALEDGDLVAARGLVGEALQSCEAAGAELCVAWGRMLLSTVESRTGNAEYALRDATDALTAFRTFNLVRGVVCALNAKAEYLVLLARYDEARTSASEALDVARQHQLDASTANALQKCAAILALRPQRIAEPGPSAYVRAAWLLGYVDARLKAIMGSGPREFNERPEYDRVLDALHIALGADTVAKMMAEGTALTEDQAVEAALKV